MRWLDDKKVSIMGMPFHGLVKNSVLTLPDTSTMAYSPAPAEGNILLQAMGTLPDRSGNTLDAANGYQWKDRLMLSGPTALPFGQIVTVDDAGIPWIVEIAGYNTSSSWGCTAKVVKRFGLISETAPTVHDYQFYDSGYNSLQTAIDDTDLTLNSITGTEFIEQSPDGQSVLIGVKGNCSADFFTAKLATVYKITISGTVNQTNGVGLSASLTVHSTPNECCAASVYSETDNSVTAVVEIVSDTVTTATPEGESCTLFPTGGGSMHVDTSVDKYTQLPPLSSFPPGTTYETAGIDDAVYEYVQTAVIAAYYDEDGATQTITFRIRDGTSVLSNGFFYQPPGKRTISADYVFPTTCSACNATVNYSSEPGERYSVNYSNATFTASEVLINGAVKSSLIASSYDNGTILYYRPDKVAYTDAYSAGAQSQYSSSSSGLQYLVSGYLYSIRSNPAFTNGSTTNSYVEVTVNGNSVYTGTNSSYSYVYCQPKLFGNRIAGIDTAGNTKAVAMGIDAVWAPTTDRATIDDKAKNYCTYDPYTGAITTDDLPVGYV